ncbi:MAG: hypothetical protein KC503_10730 [Myxococcales bacterium]|nr:hypothetical protein [Myxococcales bacterium]
MRHKTTLASTLLLSSALALGSGCGPELAPGQQQQKPRAPLAPEYPQDPNPPQPKDCSAYAFKGTTYDCSTLDRCDSSDANAAKRLACCECEPALCNPDPSCQPKANEPPPPPPPPPAVKVADACMRCHNGSQKNDYLGPGISNPHPFGTAGYIDCTTCHGGDGTAIDDKDRSHVPPPPEVGDRNKQRVDPRAFNLATTLAGIDKLPDYTVNGKTYKALDWLQFRNPGDLRVVKDKRGCGTAGCHAGQHADWVQASPFAGTLGFFSSLSYAAGLPNVFGNTNWENTAADYAWRAVSDPSYDPLNPKFGSVPQLKEWPVFSRWGDTAGMFKNPAFDAKTLDQYLDAQNKVIPDSPLHKALFSAVDNTCADCHLGSAGANNRYGDFRSSGCTACHMRYSLDGRSRSTDPHVNKNEPKNPDAIQPGERSHVLAHQIRNVYKTVKMPTGGTQTILGQDLYTCVGCHQGSNRTVLQFMGFRMDQNADVVNKQQYPANPKTFETTANNPTLYDPKVRNTTFNGRNANQHLQFEDYDGDGRDDIPEDVHFSRGLTCIDCHGSTEIHNNKSTTIRSRMDQVVHVTCQNCHGTIDKYACDGAVACSPYTANHAARGNTCAADGNGRPVKNVVCDSRGDAWLYSRRDGKEHYIPQTKSTVYQDGRRKPDGTPIYNAKASFAMGRVNNKDEDGLGPKQNNPHLALPGFSHTDKLSCASCHASWTQNCIGCHLENKYNANPNNFLFSNVTGERIVSEQANAGFTYQSPIISSLLFNGSTQRIAPGAAGTQLFYRYTDYKGVTSKTFLFSDRNNNGNNPLKGFGAGGHDAMMPHSIRGRVQPKKEGPRYCVGCHMNVDMDFSKYDQFIARMGQRDVKGLASDGFFPLLKEHIGSNTGNQKNSPYFIHMNTGLGSGLFFFDKDGCPVNPLDKNNARQGCNGASPAARFNVAQATYCLDCVVTTAGTQLSSTAHPCRIPQACANERDGADNGRLGGPLGAVLVKRLSCYDAPDRNAALAKQTAACIMLDSYLDADGTPRGGAAALLPQSP